MPNGWELLKAENVRLLAEVERLQTVIANWTKTVGEVQNRETRERERAEQAERDLGRGGESRERDDCEFCLGAKGGVKGNENRIRGVLVCDYCTVLLSAVVQPEDPWV